MTFDGKETEARDAYADLLKEVLLGQVGIPGQTWGPIVGKGPVGTAHRWLMAKTGRFALAKHAELRPGDAVTEDGSHEYPPTSAFTMIGRRRLDNVQYCVETVLAEGVRGDMIETGVWRGGTVIFMRGLLKAWGDVQRTVFVADSFQGVPPPASAYPADEGSPLHLIPELAVSADQVRDHFARFGLLDGQVRFLEGWFKDALPSVADRSWAVVRLDGDLYESTMDGLRNLYPNLSPGGFLIVDDYGAIEACRRAVHDYREQEGIAEPIEPVDWTGVYWRKAR